MNPSIAEAAATARAGQFVEITATVLGAGSRAPGLPADTAAVPLVMRTRGFLESDAKQGDEVTIATLADRRVSGVLRDLDPRHVHDFGEIDPDLLAVARRHAGGGNS